ncbi:hypothetical protein [Marinospirillum alkaliphilum]|uniref:Acetyl-CoA acetyltransferase n=1 Tax=Marinospirillum alkaliphilum DSM 21637 TaxID=1122209 RepID=A0A1K1TVX3_9GAMM|nr:hypothetical protein [Marinospirillum alkaliphilum]SFX04476.1 hypothetical protein SAMN02745752_00326 [Marinospirillum alkaliphilum DSM 21637]
MQQAYIIAAAGVQDGEGNLDALHDIREQVTQAGLKLERLVIDPLSTPWDAPLARNHFRSGCGPLEALAYAHTQLREGAFEAVLIEGKDAIRTGYNREERSQLMLQVYGEDYPLTEAYTDLARHFCREQGLDFDGFRHLRDALFENYRRSAADAPVSDTWLQPLTELFRGVDCANPYVDYAGGLLLTREDLLGSFDLPHPPIQVAGVGIGYAQGDGPDHLDELAGYWHLEKAVHYANLQAEMEFAEHFNAGHALLEAYTCYPVVPMALLLRGGFVNDINEIEDWLQWHLLTLKGGMNLNRAPWNLPALRALIEMTQALHHNRVTLGGVHGNGGLGYKQGFAILRRNP